MNLINSDIFLGGSPYAALDFARMFGLSNGSPKFYDYKGFKDTCNMKTFPAIINSGGSCIKYLKGDENELKKLVAKQPVVVGVTMTINMLYYKTGIFSDRSCGSKLDHVLVRVGKLLEILRINFVLKVIVGYDTNAAGQDYWIVRNRLVVLT